MNTKSAHVCRGHHPLILKFSDVTGMSACMYVRGERSLILYLKLVTSFPIAKAPVLVLLAFGLGRAWLIFGARVVVRL